MRRLLVPALLLPALAWAQAVDPTDARLREQAYLRAWSAPLGQATTWRNPANGDTGRITALREHKAEESDELCRDMLETLTTAGTRRRGTATGCRGADRAWHVVAATPGDAASVPADLPPYQAPADISADPPRPGPNTQPGLEIRVHPPGRNGAALPATPEIRLYVPPLPPAPN